MKYLNFVFVATIVLLAVTAKAEKENRNYNLIGNPIEPPKLGKISNDYMLEQPETKVESSALNSTEPTPAPTPTPTPAPTPAPTPDPYRICLVVRCFPKNSKFQICRCIVWV